MGTPKVKAREERSSPMYVTGLYGGKMSKQSQYLREQARRTERLASTVGDEQATQALKAMSKAFDEDAEKLEQYEQR